MFGIDGNDSRFVFYCYLVNDAACCNQGLLVGESHNLACLKRCKGGAQAAEAHHCSHYDVYTLGRYEAAKAVDAAEYLDILGLEGICHLLVFLFAADYYIVGIKFKSLLNQQFGIVVGRYEFHLEQIAVLPDYIQGLGSDGPC